MKEEIAKAVKILKQGGSIIYPTDTVWGLGCDATNQKAIKNIFNIKERAKRKNMIILLDDKNKLNKYVKDIHPIIWDLLDNFEQPTTIIYPGAKNLDKNLIAEDGSVAIRIVRDGFCKQMITELGKPIISTSANISGRPTALYFDEIEPIIKQRVDYVVNYLQDISSRPKQSRLIKLEDDGNYSILRD